MPLSFNQLKWITVLVPVAALTLLLYFIVFALPDVLLTPAGFVVTVGVIVAGAVVFSQLVFGVIGRLEQEIVRQSHRFATAATVATKLSEAEGTNEILQQVLDAVADAFSVQTGVICLLDEETDELYLCAHRGVPAPLLEQISRKSVAADPVGMEVIRERRTVLVPDLSKDSRFIGMGEQYGFWSFVSVPLLSEGRALGVLVLASSEKDRFEEEDVRVLEQIARQLGIAVQRSNLLAQVLGRNEELRLLNNLSAALTRARELTDVFAAVLASVLEVSGADRAELWLEERGQQVLADAARRDGDVGTQAPAGGIEGVLLRQRVSKARAPEIVARGEAELGCFPLQSAGHVFGLIVLENLSPVALTPRRLHLLEAIADQSAVAISNARFRVRVRELAVVEERERIAREMHDGLAQVLGYVNTKAFAVRRLLKDGDMATAQTMLGELEEAAREVYADVREGVLALRGTAPGDRSLLDNICNYLAKFERMSGIRVECRADRNVATIRLPEMSEIQVMRVIQEALTNVRKHASATSALVTLRARDGTLVARVDDDGCGFNVRGVGRRDWPQFGLQTMRERAEAIGGRFSLTSAPGRGTHVRIRVPMRPAHEVRA